MKVNRDRSIGPLPGAGRVAEYRRVFGFQPKPKSAFAQDQLILSESLRNMDKRGAVVSETLTLGYALAVLGLLQVKHMFADFFLQTPSMLRDRGMYLHPGRALHCAVHAAGTVICFVLLGVPIAVLVVVTLAEWVVHYHIDWGKGRFSDLKEHTPAHAGYWRAFGADQCLHQLTYLVMLWAVVALT